MTVTRDRFKMFSFSVMQSTFCLKCSGNKITSLMDFLFLRAKAKMNK